MTNQPLSHKEKVRLSKGSAASAALVAFGVVVYSFMDLGREAAFFLASAGIILVLVSPYLWIRGYPRIQYLASLAVGLAMVIGAAGGLALAALLGQ